MSIRTEDGSAGLLRVMGAIHASPWAITADSLNSIIAIVEAPAQDLEAVATRIGKPLDNHRGNGVENRDGVAVLQVEGPLFRYANIMTQVSGATSVQRLALDFQAALDDPAISGIVLDINSPGGQVDGINELADQIRAGSQIKPVTAYVGNQAASAAYWLASAAGRIVANESAFLGSIGIIASVTDNRGAQERQGVKRHDIVSSQSPLKNQDLATDAGRAAIQAQVDSLADLFIGRVAAFRGVSVEKVSNDFGKGGVIDARHAIGAGMADALGDYEQLVGEMRSQGVALPAGYRLIGSVTGTDMSAAVLDEEELEEQSEEAGMHDEESDCECPPGTDEEDCDCGENDDESEGTKDADDQGEEAMDKTTVQQPPQPKTAAAPPAAATVTPKAAAAEERQRIAAILNCEEAKGRENLARMLALETDHTPGEARKILGASPQAAATANAFEQRMAALNNPKVGAGPGDGKDDTAAEVAHILSFVPKDRKVAVAQ